MNSLFVALVLSAAATGQPTGKMSPTSDVSGNRVKATGSTTSRALRDRMADVVNVKDFGAKGDGVTDDTAAFRAALAAVPSTGGTVFVPPASVNYLISGGLRPKSGTTVQGTGYGSVLKMVAGGWDSYVVDSEGGDNLGLFSILRSRVRITGIRVVGTLAPVGSPSYRYDPQLVMIAGTAAAPVTDVTVDHCFFEDNAWNGVWPSGVQSFTTHLTFTDNHFTNIGRFADAGNPDRVALQLNGEHVIASRNHFERCGNAISATGSFQVISGNVMKDCWQGVLIGDTAGIIGMEVTGNQISAAIETEGDWTTPSSVTGIYANAGGVPFGHDFQIADNSVSFVLSTTTTNNVIGIVTDGVDVLLKNNHVSFDVECAWSTGTAHAIGINIEAFGNSGTTARLQGNTVSATSKNGYVFDNQLGTGIQVVPGSGKTLTAYMQGNTVRGFETGSAVSVYSTASSGTLTQYVDGDVITGGAALYGSTYVSNYNVPIRLAHSSATGTLTPTVTPLNPDRVILAPTYATTITIDSSTMDHAVIRATDGNAFALAKPTNPTLGKLLTVTIANQTGSPLGTLTWTGGTGGFHLAGSWTQPGTLTQRSATFYYDGGSWYEISRSAADVP